MNNYVLLVWSHMKIRIVMIACILKAICRQREPSPLESLVLHHHVSPVPRTNTGSSQDLSCFTHKEHHCCFSQSTLIRQTDIKNQGQQGGPLLGHLTLLVTGKTINT